MISRRWFFLENIQRGAADLAGRDCFVKRLFINQPSARAVDDARALLHFLERIGTNYVARFRSQRRVDRQKISPRKYLVERGRFDVQIA